MQERFLKVYANVPIGLRTEVIAILDDFGPVTWNVAYIEIINNTDLAKPILEKLSLLDII